MIPSRERATRLVIAALATLFAITGWSFSPAVAAPQSSRLTAELATYGYDAPFAVTTPAAQQRNAALTVRPSLRTTTRLSPASVWPRCAAKAGCSAIEFCVHPDLHERSGSYERSGA